MLPKVTFNVAVSDCFGWWDGHTAIESRVGTRFFDWFFDASAVVGVVLSLVSYQVVCDGFWIQKSKKKA
jgi:hypothetical protein